VQIGDLELVIADNIGQDLSGHFDEFHGHGNTRRESKSESRGDRFDYAFQRSGYAS
jgi:hypothetical protein